MAQDYAAKVRALLDRAEHPGTTQAEREACQSRAMELMTRHQITDAMIGNRGEVKDEVGQLTLSFTGIFAKVERGVAMDVAGAMGCKCVMTSAHYERPKKERTTITGWRTDLERLEVLNASLQLQCKTALKQWEREQRKTDWANLPGFEKYKDRREFIESFGEAAAHRLRVATEAAIKAAAAERVEESHGTETEKEALTGVALALRDRKESVKDWFDQYYGGRLRTVHNRAAAGSWGASAAGRAAGSRADIGQHRVGGGPRAIGR